MIMRNTFCTVVLVCLMGCASGTDSATDSGGDVATGALTLSGKLVAGVQTSAARRSSVQSALAAPGDPLVGYQLYCVTFATPPVATSGTADDAGQVVLSIAAVGVPFGCFILDAEDKGVATLIFTSGLQRGQTVTLTGDADLGSIVVDLDNGVAQTAVTPEGSLTRSDGLPCPLGEWTLTVPSSGECGDAQSVCWFAQLASGEYTLSFTVGPQHISQNTCGYMSRTDLPVTESGGVFSFEFEGDEGTSAGPMTFTATPNDDCTELVLDQTLTGCQSCYGDCQMGGSLTCYKQYTATRN
jgi:hypothetical protein